MATTLIRGLEYKRFVRQVRTPKDVLINTPALLDKGIEALMLATWRQARKGLTITMPPSNPEQTESSDAYDVYKFTGDCAPQSGMEAAFLGTAAYRFKLPDDAQGVIPDNITALTVTGYASKFLSAGLVVGCFVSDDETPRESWTGGADVLFNIERVGDTYGAFSGQVLKDEFAGTTKGTNKSATLSFISGPIPAKKYLWLFLQLWDWPEVKFEYWIEGAGFIDADSINVTFDREGVEADGPAVETFEFPVELEDVIEPAKVFPLRAANATDLILFPQPSEGDMALNRDVLCIAAANSGCTVVGLYVDGTVFTKNNNQPIPEGATDVISVAAGDACAFAVTRAGNMFAWGLENNNMFSIPGAYSGAWTAVCVGSAHVLGLVRDGTLVGWGGANANGERTVPGGAHGCVSLAAGQFSSWAVKADGSVVAWGNALATSTPALSGVARIFVGYTHVLALHSDGSVTLWGSNDYGESTLPVGVANTGFVSACLGNKVTALLKSDGTVVAWGNGAVGIAAFLNGQTNIVQMFASWSGNPKAMILKRSAWRQYGISAPSSLALLPAAFDPIIVRELVINSAVTNAKLPDPLFVNTQSGTYTIKNANGDISLSAATKGFRYHYRSTVGTPNKVHFSLPPLSADAVGEIYCRVLFLKDVQATPSNPIATVANWQIVWNGGVPTGYQLLASRYIRHTKFVNSVFLSTVNNPGTSGVMWMVVMPIHAPLAGESLEWDITQSGFDADAVFFYRD